jgi:hypothetical protein
MSNAHLTPVTPVASIVSASHGDDMVLLNVVTGRYYTLNRTGTRIWQWLCEAVPPATIVSRLHEIFGLEQTTAENDVEQLLLQCARAGLLENDQAI